MADDDYQEITLADLVSTIYRRKVVLISVFLVAVLVGVAVTAFTTPTYEARATVIPLEHPDIIKNYLDSRKAGEDIAAAHGDPLLSRVFPDRWDASGSTWTGEPPTPTEAGLAIAGMVHVAGGTLQATEERKITITVAGSDPVLARDVANAMVQALDNLRPTMENITISQRLAQDDRENRVEARQEAERLAQDKLYWLVLDTATTPREASSPNVTLNIALSVVLGLMLGVFSVFIIEWASNYRAQRRSVDVPEQPRPEGYRFRSR